MADLDTSAIQALTKEYERLQVTRAPIDEEMRALSARIVGEIKRLRQDGMRTSAIQRLTPWSADWVYKLLKRS